jgi:5-methylcytosine-specific restriction endonuclease McrA
MNHYRRGHIVSAKEVIDFILENEKLPTKQKKSKFHSGEFSAKIRSLRLRTFALKGLKCAFCNRVGSFFAFEVPEKCHEKTNWHLNLYSVNEHGEEMMMTMDHIHPKSKGGANSLGNTQTACSRCNFLKADKI